MGGDRRLFASVAEITKIERFLPKSESVRALGLRSCFVLGMSLYFVKILRLQKVAEIIRFAASFLLCNKGCYGNV